jgi:hypothetical protein
VAGELVVAGKFSSSWQEEGVAKGHENGWREALSRETYWLAKDVVKRQTQRAIGGGEEKGVVNSNARP